MSVISYIKRGETLLSEFIVSKVMSYVEPERKRVSKGERIGFSKKKYTAVLFFITRLSQKEIASETHVSFGLLRKWLTEHEFKESIEREREDFVKFVMDFVKNKISGIQWEKKQPYKIYLIGIKKEVRRKTIDLYIYNDLVINRIKDKVIKELVKCLEGIKEDGLSYNDFLAKILFVNVWLDILIENSKRWQEVLNKLLNVSSRLSFKEDKEIILGLLNLLLSMLEITFNEQRR